MSRQLWLTLILILVVFFVVMGLFLGLNKPDKEVRVLASEVILEPTEQDGAGVSLTSLFLLKSSELNEKEVRQKLQTDPYVAFTVKKGSEEGEFLVVPAQSLEPNRVYRFSLANDEGTPLKWAFQTKGEFRVVSSLPRNQSSFVPLDTGIEITFSHVNVDSIVNYWEISPQVEGRFEIYNKTVVFVPNSLKPSTIYTVKIKQGLPLPNSSEVLKEDFVFQFETMEEPGENHNPLAYFPEKSFEFATTEQPIFSLIFQREGSWEADVTVYAYPNAGEYIKALAQRDGIPFWAYRSRNMYQEDPANLAIVATYKILIQDETNINFIEFPEILFSGFYLAEVNLEEEKHQLWFQVSDLASYVAAAENETLFWVHDLASESPIIGAAIRFPANGNSGITGSGGLAKLPGMDLGNEGEYAIISWEGKQTVVPLPPEYYDSSAERKELAYRDSFWKYLYLDRNLYKPDDTIYYWGLVAAREMGTKKPQNMVAKVYKGWQETPLMEKRISLEGFTFSGSLNLPNLSPGYYHLAISNGKYNLLLRSFRVENYTKPAYRLDVLPDKKAVFAGDPVTFRIKATFFEGTPVPGIDVVSSYLHKEIVVTTDNQGEAFVSYTPTYEGEGLEQRDELWHFRAKLPEIGDITKTAPMTVLNSDVQIKTISHVEDTTARVEVDLRRLSVERVNKGEVETWEQGAFDEGPVSEHLVMYTIYRDLWDKEEVGEYYDFINKKVQKRYVYHHRKVKVDEGSLITDKAGQGAFAFTIQREQSYRVEFWTSDFRGQKAKTVVYLCGRSFSREHDFNWYHLKPSKETNKYQVGETVELVLQNNETLVLPRPESFLFIKSRQGILESRVQDEGIYQTVFSQDLLPNFWVRSVYFDGRFYHETYPETTNFDEKEKALDVQIEIEKNEYRPGEQVQAALSVKDSKGKPIKAIVNLNLVDEALYALQEERVDFLSALYHDQVFHGIMRTHYTHRDFYSYLGGGGGGGGGGDERKDFKDAVYFDTIVTDPQGKAQVSFRVPDNLTTWRLTYQAITEDLQATSGTISVKVRMPFFVDMVLSERYLVRDQPNITVRAFGAELAEGERVEFEAKLVSRGALKLEKSFEGKAFETTLLQLPVLEAGPYELTLKGKASSGSTDTLTLSFQVVESMVTLEERDYTLLKSDMKIRGATSGLTSLVFCDYRGGQYLEMLSRLYHVDGSRVEQKIAGILAERLLREYFPDYPTDKPGYFNPWSYQLDTGGVAILPYGDVELEQSAKLAYLCPEVFDIDALKTYFTCIINDRNETRERGIIALFGLAALGEPVLPELDLTAREVKLTVKEKLYVTLGYLAAGAHQKANPLWSEILQSYGERIGGTIRINSGGQDRDEVLEETALGAVVAANLSSPEGYGLAVYLLENQGEKSPTYLEQLLYIKQALPSISGKTVHFTYVIGSRKEKVYLEPTETFRLYLTEKDLTRLQFEDISGQVGLLVSYQSPTKLPPGLTIDGLTLTRSYQVGEKEIQALKGGDLLEIHLAYDTSKLAPGGTYRIVDFLPAGLKPASFPYQWEYWDSPLQYPVEVDGQKVVFLVEGGRQGVLFYYARPINRGSFQSESAVLEHVSSSKVFASTSQAKIHIQ